MTGVVITPEEYSQPLAKSRVSPLNSDSLGQCYVTATATLFADLARQPSGQNTISCKNFPEHERSLTLSAPQHARCCLWRNIVHKRAHGRF